MDQIVSNETNDKLSGKKIDPLLYSLLYVYRTYGYVYTQH